MFSTGSSRDFKTSSLNYLYEALVQKEALDICQDSVLFATVLCTLSVSSVLGRFMHLYWTIPEKKHSWLLIWGLKGYCRNSNWVFRELIKSNVEFPGMIKKKSCGISRGLGFRI